MPSRTRGVLLGWQVVGWQAVDNPESTKSWGEAVIGGGITADFCPKNGLRAPVCLTRPHFDRHCTDASANTTSFPLRCGPVLALFTELLARDLELTEYNMKDAVNLAGSYTGWFWPHRTTYVSLSEQSILTCL